MIEDFAQPHLVWDVLRVEASWRKMPLSLAVTTGSNIEWRPSLNGAAARSRVQQAKLEAKAERR